MDLKSLALSTLSSIPENPVMVLDAEARCVATFGSDDRLGESLGDRASELIGSTAEVFAGEHADALRETVRSVLASGTTRRVRTQIKLGSGAFDVEVVLWPLADAPYVACSLKRADPRSELESRLRMSESRFRALAAQSAPHLCEIDARGVIVYVGPSFEALEARLGVVAGRPLREILERIEIHPDDAERAAADLARILDHRGTGAAGRLRLRIAPDAWREYEWSAAWYTAAGGEPRGLILGHETPTHESAQSTSRVRALQTLAGSLVDSVIELDASGEIVSATTLPKMWVGSGENIVGRVVFDFLHPDDVERARFAMPRISQPTGQAPGVYRWRAVGGGWRAVETRAVSYSQENGGLRIVAIGRDITDERGEHEPGPGAEQGSVGQSNLALLAGGVAHDFRNLLTISLGLADLIGENLPADSQLRPYLAEIVAASRHAADLAGQLLAVTTRRSPTLSPIDLNSVIGGVEGLLRSAVPRNVSVECTPCEEPLWIDGDATQIRQVLLNLVANAGEAIGPSRPGRIQITTSRLGGRPGPGGADEADGRCVIEICDDGPGIDEQVRDRVFEPAFTTKQSGHGLGLAVVRGVIRRHGGEVSMHARPGGGTAVRIELPTLPEKAAAAERQFAARLEQERRSAGSRKILIVDDDASVRRVGAAMLGLASFGVLEAADANAARALVASELDIACAVIDILMPDVDGLALVEELRALRPGLRVVICSGVAHRVPRDRADLVVLEKPFRYAELIQAVWSSIEQPAEQVGELR